MNQQWISVTERMPVPIDKGYCKKVKVIVAWGDSPENVAEMDYETVVIRGKEISRFIWQGRVCIWNITHWMPMPEPPKKNIWKVIKEIYTDEHELAYIHIWASESEDENAESKMIAKVDTRGNVTYLDDRARTDSMAQEIISETILNITN